MNDKTPDTLPDTSLDKATIANEDPYQKLMDTDSSASSSVSLTDDTVLAYLQDNPDFFSRHEPVLAELAISHEVGGATSLLERQVLTLRARNRELGEQNHHQQRRADEQLAELVSIARSNEKHAQQLYAFAAYLIGLLKDTTDTVGVADAALAYLREQFSLAVATVITVTDAQSTSERATILANIMRYGTPICGAYDLEEVQAVFAAEQLAQIQSAAIVPIRAPERQDGDMILALGSDEPMRFHSRLGTQFLREMAKLLTPIL